MRRHDLISLAGLCGAIVLAASWTAFTQRTVRSLRDPALPLPRIELSDGRIIIDAPDDLVIRYSLDGSEPDANDPWYTGPFEAVHDERRIARLIATPTSIQWRHPVGAFPTSMVVRACVIDDHGNSGPVVTRSFPPGEAHGMLVISIVLPEEALFDPDSGIYVTGHAIFRDGEISVQRYPEDQRWWKYPGNYQFRGKEWERTAHVEVFDAEKGSWSGNVDLRINGNNTRGFPQHALRMTFDGAVTALDGRPHRSVVLRAAGNDQNRAFLRDALQHRLCAGLPFETSGTQHAIVYINGAYFGVHEVRERIDEEELALRYGLKKKDITILADGAILYRGDPLQLRDFYKLLRQAEHLDPASPTYLDSIARRLEIDDFLTYMAAQFILCNTDWPDQNVKYWRTAAGRWRFIMGDSDLGFGLNGGAEFDLFAHVQGKQSPVARLFNALMRNADLRARFRRTMLRLLEGPLSADVLAQQVQRMAGVLAPAMPDHIRRWRRPLSVGQWERSVDDLQTFAVQRGAMVRRQMDQHLPPL